MFLKVAPEAFEAGDFLNIFLRFVFFEGLFLITSFLIKKRVYIHKTNGNELSDDEISDGFVPLKDGEETNTVDVNELNDDNKTNTVVEAD